MSKPNPNHKILQSLLEGIGFTEKQHTLLVNEATGGVAAYLYDPNTGDLLQVIYNPVAIPQLVVIAKTTNTVDLRRHIYRRHGCWRVRTNNLDLNVDDTGKLT